MPYGAQMARGAKTGRSHIGGFQQLHERIEFGKRLYAILFGVPEVREGVLSFVRAVHHSGSRADYAPHLFTKQAIRKYKEATSHVQKVTGCRLNRGAKPIYSPELEEAWPEICQ